MRCTFKTVFYVNGSKERNGIVPIMGRVTINGTIAQFSCKQSVTKAIWDAKGNRAIGKSNEAKEVNFALDNIKAQIAKHYQRLSDREAFGTAEMVRNAYQGIGTEYETLLRAFDKENAAFAKRVGKDRAKNTYNKYLVVRKYVAEFIKYQYKRSDMSMNELTAMTEIKLEDPNMAFARDLFIFGCWTGISFIDIKNLTEDNICMVNGASWIISKRQKTGMPFQIKLMDIPMQIIERYMSFRKGSHLFNIGNLDSINKRIKKVAAMCSIKKRVSFHVSRHSWAVLALEYGMPIESVSKILGHTNITTTQIFAKVTSTKLDHDISVFESRIKGHLPVMGGMS